MPTPPSVKLTSTNDYRESYSNSVQVRVSVWDFFLAFGTLRTQTPEEEFETQERQELVLSMLKGLPEDQRTALLLREQEQLSYREIAEVLEVSESKVKTDIFRARTALRERWAQRVRSAGAGLH